MALPLPALPLMLLSTTSRTLALCSLALDASDYSLVSYQGEEGDQAITKAIAAPSCFVLKPQREGGGRWCPLCRAAAPVKGLAGGHQC